VEAEQEEARPAERADLYGGLFWVALGTAIAIGSWRMDRLEKLGVSFFTAPGLVPGVLGLLVILCGVVLALRAVANGALARMQRPALIFNKQTLKRVGLTLLLCIGFAVGLVGHGTPFWVAAALYLFAQIAVLQYRERKARGETGRGLLIAALVALVAAGAVSFMFQEVFLVRLP
jgi:hypothetical protein